MYSTFNIEAVGGCTWILYMIMLTTMKGLHADILAIFIKEYQEMKLIADLHLIIVLICSVFKNLFWGDSALYSNIAIILFARL